MYFTCIHLDDLIRSGDVSNLITETLFDAVLGAELAKKYKTVDESDAAFYFTIVNDTDEEFQLCWIGYEGKAKPFSDILNGKEFDQKSCKGHVWFLKGSTKYYVFTCGKGEFTESGCIVSISNLTEESK